MLDARHLPLADANVILEVTTPLGGVEEIALERALDNEGFHRASFIAQDIGRHEVRVRLSDPNGEQIESQASVEVSGAGSEFHAAELDAARLLQLAEATGGRFFRASEAADVVDALDDTRATVRIERRLPLRDAPALLVLLIVLACVEWAWRRRRGLA